MKLKVTALSIIALSALSSAFLLHAAAAPGTGLTVDITRPSDGAHLPWNSQVPYAVTVTYDGKSTKFGEIPAKHVLLRAAFAADTDAPSAREGASLPEGLLQISQSNCTGCHDFAANSAAPSFAAVAKRYQGDGNAIAMLAQHIRNGSSRAWGSGTMPPHPDMSEAQAKAIAQWITRQAGDHAVSYAIGTSGSFRMSAPRAPGPHAGMVLSAFYTGPLKAGEQRTPVAGKSRVVVYGSGS